MAEEVLRFNGELYKRVDAVKSESELAKHIGIANTAKTVNKDLAEIAFSASALVDSIRSFYMLFEHPKATKEDAKKFFNKCVVEFNHFKKSIPAAEGLFKELEAEAMKLV